ncbi:DoxX family protein [Streptomyces sp. ASQP_92]|uniref:DoxX family protein n=1 Tax=Streptomyces sp. ASQP_92 TaxID=2979116 RepID=UPI0021C0E9CD|nr:DoxX family protein [Streptomyces sp. ASQP_92]MCT9093821.1 DoxX family protein [Streptomyces sp. ASQP_92]
MAPLIVLVVGWILARLAGLLGLSVLDGWQPALCVALALMFTLTGVAHFTGRRAGMIAMVPPALPRADLLVTATGLLELAGAGGLLLPVTRPLAAIALTVMLLAMFPANVHAARSGLMLNGKPVMPLVPRTFLQVAFVAACVLAAL